MKPGQRGGHGTPRSPALPGGRQDRTRPAFRNAGPFCGCRDIRWARLGVAEGLRHSCAVVPSAAASSSIPAGAGPGTPPGGQLRPASPARTAPTPAPAVVEKSFRTGPAARPVGRLANSTHACWRSGCAPSVCRTRHGPHQGFRQAIRPPQYCRTMQPHQGPGQTERNLPAPTHDVPRRWFRPTRCRYPWMWWAGNTNLQDHYGRHR